MMNSSEEEKKSKLLLVNQVLLRNFLSLPPSTTQERPKICIQFHFQGGKKEGSELRSHPP